MSSSCAKALESAITAAVDILERSAEEVRKQAPSKDMDKEKLESLRDQRSSKYGIEVLEDGSKLTFPADGPDKLELYGDPVNLKYPVDTKGRATNARVRFKQFADTYTKTASKKVIHERIIRAELKLGASPAFDPTDPLDKLLPSDLRSELTKSAPKHKVRKGLPGELVEGGIHLHGLTREASITKEDGRHCHVFVTEQPLDLLIDYGDEPREERFQAGMMLCVDGEDGAHVHKFTGDALSNDTASDGEHYHVVYLPDGTVLETVEDGAHSHELQVSTTAFDGMHTHVLELPNGETITSTTPGQLWEYFGMWEQACLPVLPPASLFAMLAPETRGALMAMPISKSDGAPVVTPAVPAVTNYETGTFQTIKVANPKFLIKRLRLQKSAGILSLRRRKSRIDVPQALVNELANFEASFVWGVIKHAEPVAYKLSDVPEEVWDSLAPDARELFKNTQSNLKVFYLPFELVKAFNEPKKLKAPPAGRRFAGTIDLSKDVVNISKCQKCQAPYECEDTTTELCSDCREHATRVTKCSKPERKVRIVKSDEAKDERIVFGVVLVPNDTDAQGDIYNAEEVRKAAYSFMEVGKGQMKVMHNGELLGDKVAVLETYVSKQEEAHGEEIFPMGTWFITTRVYDDGLWSDVKKGVWGGYSIGGDALREPLN